MTGTKDHLRQGLEEIASHASISDAAWDDIIHRLAVDDTEAAVVTPMEEPERLQTGPRSGTRPALVAMAAAIVVALGLSWGTSRNLPATTDLPDESTSSVESVERQSAAVKVIDRYIAAFNRGDIDGATAVFADGVITRARSSIRNSGGNPPVDAWQIYLEWLLAQGGKITDVDCQQVSLDGPVAAVECSWRQHDAVSLATDHPGTLVELQAEVESNQITVFDYTETLDRAHGELLLWEAIHQPDGAPVFLDWNGGAGTRRRAQEMGREYASLVEEWAEGR